MTEFAMTFCVAFAIALPIVIVCNGVKLRWFIYWTIRGRPHPDHVAKSLADMKERRK